MRDPRRSLAVYYAAYFACIGIILPFLPPWIKDRGFPPATIGLLLALMPLAKIVSPWTWGWLADRTGRRKGLMVAATAVAAVSLFFLSLQTAFVPIFVLLAVYAFAVAPGLPFTEATALEQSERHRFDYGPIRMWGSITFMVVSVGFGSVADDIGEGPGLMLGAAFLVLAVAASMRMPRPDTGRAAGTAGTATGHEKGIVRLFIACALMQASHGAYYTFFTIYMLESGYNRAAVGWFWALAVLCEILLLTRIDRVINRLGTSKVQQICTVAAAVRWLLIYSSAAVAPLALAQVLHSLTYAAFHVSSLREVHLRFGSGSRATGQTMYSGLTFGLGIFVGTLVAGRLAGSIGYPALFACSAGVALAAFLMLRTVPKVPSRSLPSPVASPPQP